MTPIASGKQRVAFVALPMSSVSPQEYEAYRQLVVTISNDVGSYAKDIRVFCPAISLESTNFDDPADAYRSDIDAIKEAEKFILIFPKPALSGAIFEAGVAVGLGLPVSIYVTDRAQLPFMLRRADHVSGSRVRITEHSDLASIASIIVEDILSSA